MGTHDDSHAPLQPRPEECETPADLDWLLELVTARWNDLYACDEAVTRHISSLMAGIAQPSHTGRRARIGDNPAMIVLWLELELSDRVDDLLVQMWTSDSTCAECGKAWTRHLLQARSTLRTWAWERGMSARLPPA